MNDAAYAVIIADDASLRPMDIARALAAARKVPALDLMGAARRSWGIIEEAISKEAAEAVQQALAKGNIAALVIPTGLLEDIPPIIPATALEFSGASLNFFDRQEQRRQATWESLSIIATAAYTVITGHKSAPDPQASRGKEMLKAGFSLMTGIPTSLGMGPKPVEKKSEVSDQAFLLDLYLKGPVERLRIEPQRFDFSCLKARMGFGMLGNIRILLEELTRHAPLAATSRGAKVLLENRPFREMGYEGPADLDRESRWRLTLAALKNPG